MGNSIGPMGAGQTSASSSQNADTQSTTVMVGETKLSQIAERLGIPLQSLIAANPNINAGNVNAGQELKLPVQAEGQAPQAPVTQEAPVTARSQTKAQTREFGLGGVMRELQLKQMLGAESTAKPPMFDGVKSADTELKRTPEMRFALLPYQLNSLKNVPQKVRDELLALGSKLKGNELDSFMNRVDLALGSKDPAGEVKSLVMGGRIDAYKESFNSTYEVNGKQVQAMPHFRIGDSAYGTGASGPAGRHGSSDVQEDLTKLIQTGDKAHWNDKMKQSVHMVAYGRGNAEQIQMVTQSLIRSGQFDQAKKDHPGLNDSDTIRMMQWDHGIGIDCAGYVQQAFLGVHGGTREKYGFQPRIGDENLMYLKGKFNEVKPANVKPGDLIALNPPQKNDVGHTILVRDHHEMGNLERQTLYKNMTGFAGPSDKVHIYSGDASWSGGVDGDLKGGVQRRIFLYNETTGKWADVTPSASGGYDVSPSSSSGPYNHPLNGIYRPKGE
jgi:LysM repeat protein